MCYSEVVEEINDLLTENQPEWEARYEKYARQIVKNGSVYQKEASEFRVKAPLYRYTNISIAKGGKPEYDIRFCGQSVATVTIKNGKIFISSRQANNKKYFGIDISLEDAGWNSKEASKFRAGFTKELHKEEKGKSREHHVENILLAEFNKKKSIDKRLCNIQPIKLCGSFFQMPTPLSASKKSEYAGQNGGGIDILARVKHKDNSVHICVMELKDENKSAEPPEEAMKQAIAYATFIARLLRSNSGKKWYEIFGFGKEIPETLTIDVAIVMPFDEDRNENFETMEKIKVAENTCLKLYSLYFKKNENSMQEFSGSLKNDMLIHKK